MSKAIPNFTFLEQLVGHMGDDCVIWPFGRDTSGYGQVPYKGKVRRAHRVMCEMVKGPAPSNDHEAAHSCGKGHEGCVNPNHLSWKTPTENKLDTIAHGNGRKHGGPRRKLTDAQVAEIRALKGKKTYRQIAALYGVNHRTVGLIITGYERPDRPKRHGVQYSPEQRATMAARAKELRSAGKSYRQIGIEIGCSRLTAKTLAAA